MNPLPRLHVVTDDAVLASAGFAERAQAVLAAGGSELALHLRGPHTTGRALYELAEILTRDARAVGALLVVNDRVDVALSVGAGAVQLGERSLPVAEARTLLPPDVRVGASVHGPERARAADGEGADFLVVGTVFETASHPGRSGAGPELIRTVARATSGPLIGIGGIDPDRVRVVLDAGAYGVASLGGVWEAPEPAAAVTDYLSALGAGSGPGT